MGDVISIKSEEDFCKLLDKIDDFNFISSYSFCFEIPKVKIHLEGEQFHSSLTGEIIRGLNKYQESVYKCYRHSVYGTSSRKRLSEDELRKLEIKVTVSEGSTELLLSFVQTVMEGKNMTGEQMLWGISIVAGAWLIKGIATPIIKGCFTNSRKKIELQAEKAKDEKEKDFYTNVSKNFENISEGVKNVLTSVASSQSKTIEIDNQAISPQEIKKYAEEINSVQKEKVLEKTYVVEGDFRVLNLNYEHKVTLMKALHVETNEIFENISLQNEWISQDSYNMIQDAEKREPIFLVIVVQEKGTKRNCTVDVKRIGSKK